MTKFEQAQEYLIRAGNRLDDAVRNKERMEHPECVSACQECIELSVKAIHYLLGEDFDRDHKINLKKVKQLWDKLPKRLQDYNFVNVSRLCWMANMWQSCYTIAKYGDQYANIGASTILKGRDAILALHHARECYSSGKMILDMIR